MRTRLGHGRDHSVTVEGDCRDDKNREDEEELLHGQIVLAQECITQPFLNSVFIGVSNGKFLEESQLKVITWTPRVEHSVKEENLTVPS